VARRGHSRGHGALRRRYGRAKADTVHFEHVARNFMHPILMREMTAIGRYIVTEKDVQELTGLLERVATRAREGKL
jgi:hypothetical protein